MCDYCEKLKSLYYDRNGTIEEVFIEEDKILSICHEMSEHSISIEINYCPMCGQKLR
jgi:Zn-finger nucleic acid-binding protein